ncbi:MAG: hypothetical protein OEV42_20835 [Deltaproteobacteria bacterium]|nr:hypothetical protein [Deltaproteobacteria bacterium]
MPAKYFIIIAAFLLFYPSWALSGTTNRVPPGEPQKLFPLFEEHYLAGAALSYEESSAAMDSFLAQGEALLLSIERSALSYLPEKLDKLRLLEIKICGRASAEKRFAAKALTFIYKARRRMLHLSRTWPGDNTPVRDALYRTLSGGRLASEEVLVRLDDLMLSPLIMLGEGKSLTPAAVVQGIKVHSGDVLISGGGGLVSLLIARGNARPGKYSHSAIIYVDDETGEARVLSSFPFRGTVKMSLAEYLERSNYSAILLRPASYVPALREDPLLPHKAASFIWHKAESAPASYDHEMNWNDDKRFFPEEMILTAYNSVGISLWAEREAPMPPVLIRWFDSLGLSGHTFLPPSYLEYDSHFVPIAEWINKEALGDERLTFAVMDALLHSAAMGAEVGYSYDEVPLALLAKTWSVLAGYRGRQPSVPDGLSPFEALRIRTLSEKVIPVLREDTRRVAHWFKEENGRNVNYLELRKIAEKALQGRKNDLEGYFKTYEAEIVEYLR